MKIRGERECRACGARWSYYTTGSVECPDCESVRSVGVDARTIHTDTADDLDLSAFHAAAGQTNLIFGTEDADELKTTLRNYTRQRGFITGGTLKQLDETVLAAHELIELTDLYVRLRDPTEAEQAYALDLLLGADRGERPRAAEVPDRLREARGLAAVYAATEYRRDLLTVLDKLTESSGTADGIDGTDGEVQQSSDTSHAGTQQPNSTPISVEGTNPIARVKPARDVLERLRDTSARIEALNGDVEPKVADALVDAADAVGMFVRTGTEQDLEHARQRLTDITR